MRKGGIISKFGIIFLSLVIVIFVILPLIAVSLWAFSERWPGAALFPEKFGIKWFELLISSGALQQPLTYSITIGIIVVLGSAAISIPAAYVVGVKKFRGREIVESLVLMPLIVPPIATGVGILGYYTQMGFRSNMWAVVTVHMIGATPFMFRSVEAAFESIDPALEDAARVLGASRLRTLIHIYLPLITPGLLAGSVFAFAWSLNEFILTLLVGLPDIITLPVQIFRYVGGYYIQVGPVSALSIVLLIPSIIFLVLSEKYIRAEFVPGAGVKG